MVKKIVGILSVSTLALLFLLGTVSATSTAPGSASGWPFPGMAGQVNSQSYLNSVNPIGGSIGNSESLCARTLANSYGDFGYIAVMIQEGYITSGAMGSYKSSC